MQPHSHPNISYVQSYESVGAKLTNSEDSGFSLSGSLAVTHPSIVCVCAVRMVVVLYGLFLLGILKKKVYPFNFKLLNSVWVQYTLEGYNIVLLLDPGKV